MIMIPEMMTAERFAALYREVTQGPVPPFSLSFYPYTTFKNTVRKRNGCLLFRLSDVQRDAPAEVIEAAVVSLLCALFKKRIPLTYRKIQDSYVNQGQVQVAAQRNRASRGTKRVVSPQGAYHDLSKILQEMNDAYFQGELQVKGIYWSPKRPRRRLGYWDPAHRIVVISRRLDSPDVPEYVVRFVVFHELLHVAMPPVEKSNRMHYHTRIFRDQEKRFVDYDQAKWFIDNKLE
jgi:predicted metal-dependent hydrolase